MFSPGTSRTRSCRSSSCPPADAPGRAIASPRACTIRRPGQLVTSANVPAPGRASPAASRLRYSSATSVVLTHRITRFWSCVTLTLPSPNTLRQLADKTQLRRRQVPKQSRDHDGRPSVQSLRPDVADRPSAELVGVNGQSRLDPRHDARSDHRRRDGACGDRNRQRRFTVVRPRNLFNRRILVDRTAVSRHPRRGTPGARDRIRP